MIYFQKWPRQSKYEIIIFDIINAHQFCVINHFVLIRFFLFHSQGKDVRWSRDSIAFDQNTCSDVVLIWRFLMFFCQSFEGAKSKRQYFCQRYIFAYFNIFVSSYTFKHILASASYQISQESFGTVDVTNLVNFVNTSQTKVIFIIIDIDISIQQKNVNYICNYICIIL